jgi:hypothetical protein
MEINTFAMKASNLAFAVASLGGYVDTEISGHIFSALEALIGYDEALAAVADALRIVETSRY